MIPKRLVLATALFFISAFASSGYGQDSQKEDSLRAAIRDFDVRKTLTGEVSASPADTIKADLLSQLVILNYVKKPEEAFRESQEQYKLSQQIGYQWGIANALEMQGNIHEYRREYDKALHFHHQALKLYLSMGNLSAIDIYNNIGVIYSKKGIYTEALKYHLLGLELAQKKEDVRGVIGTYNNIGIIYNDQQKYDDALFYYFKCLKEQLKVKEQYGISHTYHNIGEIYREKQLYPKALQYYNLSLESARKEGNDQSTANTYSSLGSLRADSGNYAEALRYHEQALALRKKINDTYGLITSYMAFGDIYLKTGNYTTALKFSRDALQLIKPTGELSMLTECYRQLSEIYAVMGNYKEAYANMQLYKKYSDSVFNTENERKITAQQMNFDFKNIQEKKDRLAKEEIQQQKIIRNSIIAGLCALGFFIIIFLLQRHRHNTLKKQEEYSEGIDVLQHELTLREIEAQSLKVENENMQLKSDLMAVEKEYEHKEKEKLQEKLESNRRELASTTLYLFQKNQKLSELKTEIDAIKEGTITNDSLEKLKTKIQQNLYLDADWDKFKLHFEQVHPNFFRELDEKHPGLTNYEVRLYSYIHMKLSTKEIAGLLNITPASVIKAKARLNKKLGRNINPDAEDEA